MIRRGRIVQEVVLPAAPEAVFPFLTVSEQLIRWLGHSAEVSPRPGGVFRCEVAPAQFWEGLFLEVDPPGRLLFTLGWRDPAVGLPPGLSIVELNLYSDAGGSRLRLRHEHVPIALQQLHNDAWSRFFVRLRNVVAGRAPGPFPSIAPPRTTAPPVTEQAAEEG